MASLSVTLTFEDSQWQDLLKYWQEPAVKKTLKAGAAAFGKAAKPVLKSMTPVAPSGNKYATQGNLQRVTKYKRVGARYGIGVVIGPMGKTAFYRHMVVGGTKAHIILPKGIDGRLAILGGFAAAVHHPGAKANPYVNRAIGRMEAAGYPAAEHKIFDGLEGKHIFEETDAQ